MAILYSFNPGSGKVDFKRYGISNGDHVILCDTEARANALIHNRRYGDYVVIESDDVPASLEKVIKGVRFDTEADADAFINGGGYLESTESRISDIENILAEMIGGEA